MRTLWLDVDGVFCDFAGGVINLHNKIFKDFLKVEDCREYRGLEKMVKNFNGMLSRPGFWQGLEPYPDAQDVFFRICSITKNWYFLTRVPTDSVTAFHDKAMWLELNLGKGTADRMVTARDKEIVVAPGDLLVDDYDRTVQKCVESGAHAVCVARPWNSKFSCRTELRDLPRVVENWVQGKL